MPQTSKRVGPEVDSIPHPVLVAFMLGVLIATAASSVGRGQDVPVQSPEMIQARDEFPIRLDLPRWEQIALERNPTLVQAGAQVRISRGKALQAGLFPNPEVGFVAEQIGADGTAGELHGAFFEQQIITGGKLQLSRAKFAQEAREAELQVLAQRYRVLYGVRTAFYTTLARQRRWQLHQQLFNNSQEVTRTVQELVNVGQANRADLLQSQIQVQRAQADLRTAERRFQGSWQELTAVAGVPDIPPAALEGELELRAGTVLDREAALINLLTCSPQLRVARAEVVRDRIAVERERAEPIPNLHVRAETGYNYESQNTVAGIEIGLRVPLFDQNQGTILQARAELARAQADVARIELLLRKQFAESFTEYEIAVLSAKTYRDEALPKAEEVYRLYFESFQRRRAAWPQVLDAQREYFEFSEDYLDHLLQARRAETRITSMFLEDGLSQPPTPTPEGHREATPRPR